MPVDVSCSNCGREPSHPQVSHRFTYAAYHRTELSWEPGRRSYIAALCEPCYAADRRMKTSTARNRFFREVRRWSSLAGNQRRVVRLLEHPEGVAGDEWEADNCFLNGVALACSSLPPEERAEPTRRVGESEARHATRGGSGR